DDQVQPVLGLRLQHRRDPARRTRPAEPDARRRRDGGLERVRGEQQPAPASVQGHRPRRRRHRGGPMTDTTPVTGAEPAPPHGYTDDKARYLARLRRIEGQVRGLHRMVAEDEYCIDILTQVSAATRALEG